MNIKKLTLVFLLTLFFAMLVLRMNVIAGGGYVLISSHFDVGEHTTLTAYFNGSLQCQNNAPFPVDGLIFNANFLENPFVTLGFEESTVEVEINNEIIPGHIVYNIPSVIHWAPDAGEIMIQKYDSAIVKITNINIREPNLVGFWFYFKNNGQRTCHGFDYTLETRDETDSASFYKRFGGIPQTPTPTQFPTPTNTPTPTPTPTPVPFDQIGYAVDKESIEVTVVQGGSQVHAVNLENISGASQYSIYGYVTDYGPGINTNVASGGSWLGLIHTIKIYAIQNVPLGTYTGYMKVKGEDPVLYSQLPVTVHVVDSIPTPTPTNIPTPTATPTSTPSPTETPTPDPTPTPIPDLELSNVSATNITNNSATITWNTNIAGTSYVRYGRSASRMDSYTVETPTTQTEHSVSLSGLKKRKTYYFVAVSRDYLGNPVESEIHSFTTE